MWEKMHPLAIKDGSGQPTFVGSITQLNMLDLRPSILAEGAITVKMMNVH